MDKNRPELATLGNYMKSVGNTVFSVLKILTPDCQNVMSMGIEMAMAELVPGSLDKKDGRRCHLLLHKILHLLPLFCKMNPTQGSIDLSLLNTVQYSTLYVQESMLNFIFFQ
jgi:hypothetical protein